METVPLDAGVAELRALAEKAAAAVRPHLAAAGLAEYRSFLSMMFHYTRGSGDKAQKAGRDCPSPDLKAFFEHMYREERGHYLLAEADLKSLGYTPHPETPPPVAAFNDYWASLSAEQYTAYVGALVVFENIASHVGEDVVALVRRLNLQKTQSRWLLVHVEADAEHGPASLAFAEKYLAADQATLLAGARRACELWIDIFTTAFDRPVDLPKLS